MQDRVWAAALGEQAASGLALQALTQRVRLELLCSWELALVCRAVWLLPARCACTQEDKVVGDANNT